MNNKFLILFLCSHMMAMENIPEVIDIESQQIENTPKTINAKQSKSLWSTLNPKKAPTTLEVNFHDEKSKCEKGLNYSTQLCGIISIGVTALVSIATLIVSIIAVSKSSKCE